MKRSLCMLALCLAAAGCDPTTPLKPTSRPATGPAMDVHLIRTGDGLTGIHLDIYVLDVPAGTISDDASFWRVVDEDAVDAAAGQQLQDNGIRCGVAPRSQWRRFAEALGPDLNRARKTRVDGWATHTISLDVGQPVEREDLFFVNADHVLEGHTYDLATNGIGLTFGPTPRRPDCVRLTLCPTVRRQFTRTDYSPTNQAYEQQDADVQRIYDVGLTVDVPPDGFFVAAPGPAAESDPDTTLGGRFFLHREAAARREQVVVIVPKLIPLNAGSSMQVAG